LIREHDQRLLPEPAGQVRTMSEPWSAGTFLAKARELTRRLRVWHVTDFQSPIGRASLREARRWVRLTFREIIRAEDPGPPPHTWQLFLDPEPAADGKDTVGEAHRNPDRDTDRSLTQWLLQDFRFHLDQAPCSPSFDYLRGVFNQFLDLPAWEVADPAEFNFPGPRGVVTGRPVPTELLDALVDAAARLLGAAQLQPAGGGEAGLPASYGATIAAGLPSVAAFPAKWVDATRCPGCETPTPAEAQFVREYDCPQCGRFRLHTCTLTLPVAAVGSPPAVIRTGSPYWLQITGAAPLQPVQPITTGPPAPAGQPASARAEAAQYVTLDQAAALVSRSK
jgi:hypothetical protein